MQPQRREDDDFTPIWTIQESEEILSYFIGENWKEVVREELMKMEPESDIIEDPQTSLFWPKNRDKYPEQWSSEMTVRDVEFLGNCCRNSDVLPEKFNWLAKPEFRWIPIRITSDEVWIRPLYNTPANCVIPGVFIDGEVAINMDEEHPMRYGDIDGDGIKTLIVPIDPQFQVTEDYTLLISRSDGGSLDIWMESR